MPETRRIRTAAGGRAARCKACFPERRSPEILYFRFPPHCGEHKKRGYFENPRKGVNELLIINAHILPMVGEEIAQGFLQIENGKIVSLGPMAEVPQTGSGTTPPARWPCPALSMPIATWAYAATAWA